MALMVFGQLLLAATVCHTVSHFDSSSANILILTYGHNLFNGRYQILITVTVWAVKN